jgi:hypothetical protein
MWRLVCQRRMMLVVLVQARAHTSHHICGAVLLRQPEEIAWAVASSRETIWLLCVSQTYVSVLKLSL